MDRRDGRSVERLMPRKQVLSRKTPLERKSCRKTIGKLRTTIVAAKTEERYKKHVSLFLDFLHKHAYHYPANFLQLDELASVYLEHLWEEGEPKSWAGDTLSGLGHFFPPVKPCLNGAWRLHAAWGRAELPARAMPFTLLIVYACAQIAFELGWSDTAVLLCLGFHRFPRSGELFAARVGDFELGRDCKGVWALPLTKSGQRVGAKESLTIDDPWIGMIVREYCKGLLPGDFISKVSPGVQRARLTKILQKLGLDIGFRWYSLRRGGATHLFRKSNNMGLVCHIGRWGSPKTARIYLTDGLAQLTELRLTETVKARLRALALKARPDFESV
jgi:hypothetical protein